ncbi:cytochrome c [bacterium]|nr:cytochrome c [bacterium]MBU1983339.1 cytochrome c [bacterium]
MQNGSHLFERTLPLFLAILTAIVVIFQAQLTLKLNAELADLKTQIAASKPAEKMRTAVRPFAALEQNCTSCHSERRFTGIHGTASELENVVRHMENMPGAHLSPADVDKIHGSLRMLQCVRCHDESVLGRMGAMTPREQQAVIERMAAKPGSQIAQEEIENIQRGFQRIQGF